MHGIAPTVHLPRLFTSQFSCFKIPAKRGSIVVLESEITDIRVLPEMVDFVKPSNLGEPGTDRLHKLLTGFNSAAPVFINSRHQASRNWIEKSNIPNILPLEQSSWLKGVGTKFEDTSLLARGTRWEKSKLLAELLVSRNQKWAQSCFCLTNLEIERTSMGGKSLSALVGEGKSWTCVRT
jgi:hypothetical protein